MKCSFFKFGIILLIVLFFGCEFNTVNTTSNDEENSTSVVLSAPVISPASGDYSEGFKEISITCGNEGGALTFIIRPMEKLLQLPTRVI